MVTVDLSDNVVVEEAEGLLRDVEFDVEVPFALIRYGKTVDVVVFVGKLWRLGSAWGYFLCVEMNSEPFQLVVE